MAFRSLALPVLMAGLSANAVTQRIDTILINGKVVAADERGTHHQALAVSDGRGVALRGPEETPSRLEALRMYTSGSAWLAHDDSTRGKLADLAVLSKDYLSVPLEEIGGIHSLLTLVGGRAVYADWPFATLERRR